MIKFIAKIVKKSKKKVYLGNSSRTWRVEEVRVVAACVVVTLRLQVDGGAEGWSALRSSIPLVVLALRRAKPAAAELMCLECRRRSRDSSAVLVGARVLYAMKLLQRFRFRRSKAPRWPWSSTSSRRWRREVGFCRWRRRTNQRWGGRSAELWGVDRRAGWPAKARSEVEAVPAWRRPSGRKGIFC